MPTRPPPGIGVRKPPPSPIGDWLPEVASVIGAVIVVGLLLIAFKGW